MIQKLIQRRVHRPASALNFGYRRATGLPGSHIGERKPAIYSGGNGARLSGNREENREEARCCYFAGRYCADRGMVRLQTGTPCCQ